jgi:multisubunit Na+/H+ antiporter MnhB subunit
MEGGVKEAREAGEPVDLAPRPASVRLLVAVPTLVLALALGWAVVALPEPPVDLAARVAEDLPKSGVAHPITAVLLNFRSYDTLLEIGVLLLAAICVWSLGLRRYRREREVSPNAAPILYGLVRLVVPVMVLVSGYLLYAGSSQPGGAFQAGAVLASAGVLLLLTDRVTPPLHRGGVLASSWPEVSPCS